MTGGQRDPAPKIVVVGGVAGGASAAARARRMSERARIIVFERETYISFANCGLPYFLGGEITDRAQLLVASPELFEQRFRIEVHVRHEVLRIDRAARTVTVRDLATGGEFVESYDKLILSPGATPIVPDLPGIAARGVFTLRSIEDMDRIAPPLPGAQRAAVVGAGYIGLEVAEQFRRRGLAVTVVELQPQVLPFLDREIAEPVQREIEVHGVELVLGRGIAAIESEHGAATGVALTDGGHEPADLVLLRIGVRPVRALAAAAGLEIGPSGGIATDAWMRTSDPEIYAVGDAAEYAFGPTGTRMRVALAGIANRTGRLAGEHAAVGTSRPGPAGSLGYLRRARVRAYRGGHRPLAARGGAGGHRSARGSRRRAAPCQLLSGCRDPRAQAGL